MKKIVLRVDGNSTIGLGHVYRAIAIAEMLKGKYKCEFLSSAISNLDSIVPNYFKIIYIPSNVILKQEHDWIKNNYNCDDVIILDGYKFNTRYQKKLKEENFKLVYIDDLQQEVMYADVVINHSPNIDPDKYRKMNYTKLFLGPKYVLLRNSFLAGSKAAFSEFYSIKKVLIAMGGSDESNLTGLFLNSLIKIEEIEKIDVIIGSTFKHKKMLMSVASKSDKKIEFYYNISESEVATVMKNADAAFSPCSTTTLELIALNKVIFAGYSADNQRNLYKYLKSNAIIGLEDLKKISQATIINIVKENLNNTLKLKKLLTFQKQIIDGNSKERINSIIEEL